jgi:cytochrome d ubiquinol oxidase subunit II
MPVISVCHSPWHGLEAVMNLRNLLLGFSIFFLARVLGSLYFINNIADDLIVSRSRKQVLRDAISFLVLFLPFLVWTLFSQGFAVQPDSGIVFLEKGKYFFNFIQMPLVGLFFLIGVVLLLYGIFLGAFSKTSTKGIWFAGIGTVLAVLTLLLNIGYNHTSFYPSVFDLQSSLTIYNSSSSFFTLKVMSVVSLLIPFVLAYIVYVWRVMDKKKIDKAEMNEENEKY